MFLLKFLKPFKTSLMNQTKTIGTHNGVFHADEVLACLMLVNYT